MCNSITAKVMAGRTGVWIMNGKKNRTDRDTMKMNHMEDHVFLIDQELNVLSTSGNSDDLEHLQMIGRKCYEVYRGLNCPCPSTSCIVQQTLRDGLSHERDLEIRAENHDTVYLHSSSHPALLNSMGKPTAVVNISSVFSAKSSPIRNMCSSERGFRQSNFQDIATIPFGKCI